MPWLKSHVLVEVPIQVVGHTLMDGFAIAQPIGSGVHQLVKLFRGKFVLPGQAQLSVQRPRSRIVRIKAWLMYITGVHDARQSQDPGVRVDIERVPHQENLPSRREDAVKLCTGGWHVDPMPGLGEAGGV